MSYQIKFGTDGWRALIAREFTVANVARVAEGVAGEGGERDFPVGDALADVAQGQRVVAGEGEIAQGGEGERHGHPVRRQVVEEEDDVLVAEIGQLAAEQPEGQREEEQAEKRGELRELDRLQPQFRTSPSA